MKKGLAITIAGVIIVAAAVSAYVIGVKSNEPTTKPAETSSVSEVTESTTKAATTETTTAESTTETTIPDNVDLVFNIKGAYYVYDDKNTTCYAFLFGKDNKVKVAQFEEINILYEDPQYEKGTASYKVDGDKVIIKKMPGDMALSSVEFTIKDGVLYRDGKEVEHHDDLKISYAQKHFG